MGRPQREAVGRVTLLCGSSQRFVESLWECCTAGYIPPLPAHRTMDFPPYMLVCRPGLATDQASKVECVETHLYRGHSRNVEPPPVVIGTKQAPD